MIMDFAKWRLSAQIRGRNEKQLSIRQLAHFLGTHSSVVGKIETGGGSMFLNCQYCEALGLNPYEGLSVLNNKNLNLKSNSMRGFLPLPEQNG